MYNLMVFPLKPPTMRRYTETHDSHREQGFEVHAHVKKYVRRNLQADT
jgi:hypothetical protein